MRLYLSINFVQSSTNRGNQIKSEFGVTTTMCTPFFKILDWQVLLWTD